MDHVRMEKYGTGLPYEVQLRSDIGGRSEQQDGAYAYLAPDLLFTIVCDGMGGTEQGGQASKIAVDAMEELLKLYLSQNPRCDTVRFLRDSMTQLDSRVSQSLGRHKGGTTAVAVTVQNGQLFWFSAGDSRLYIFRGGELVQATRDHNYHLRLDEQLQKGEIDRDFYDREMERGEALISFLGVGGLPVYDLTNTPLPLMDGDILLLTTDGLYKALPTELIRYVLGGRGSLAQKADQLKSQITVLKNTVVLDNTTFALIRIDKRGTLSE